MASCFAQPRQRAESTSVKAVTATLPGAWQRAPCVSALPSCKALIMSACPCARSDMARCEDALRRLGLNMLRVAIPSEHLGFVFISSPCHHFALGVNANKAFSGCRIGPRGGSLHPSEEIVAPNFASLFQDFLEQQFLHFLEELAS